MLHPLLNAVAYHFFMRYGTFSCEIFGLRCRLLSHGCIKSRFLFFFLCNMAKAVRSVSNKVSIGNSIAIGMWLEDDERYFKIRPLVSDRSQQYRKSALSVYIKKNKTKQNKVA